MLTITDVSQPNQLGIINSQGEEGYIPALCCILPTPDKNALSTAERWVLRPRETWALQAATQRKHNYIHIVITFTTLACVLQASHSAVSWMDRECEEDTETAVRIP